MKIAVSSELDPHDLEQVYRIWNRVYPVEVSFQNVNAFLENLDKNQSQKHYLIRTKEYTVSGWAMTFDRNGLRFFMLLVDEKMQGKGIGKGLLSHVMKEEEEINGWVVVKDSYKRQDGSPYHSPIDFYKKLGFKETGEVMNAKGLETILINWKRSPTC